MLPLWDTHRPRPGTGGVTRFLVVVNALVFGGQVILALVMPAWFDALINHAALVPARWVEAWGTWAGWGPVLSSMFLHGGLAHVAGNLWFLFVFGRSLEDAVGAFGFALIYLVTGVAAALAQVASEPASLVPMIGASGAISGVLGAYLVALRGRWVVALVPWIVPVLPVPAVVFLGLWFAVQFANGVGSVGATSGGGVAWWAHAGGFLAGMGLAALAGTTKPGQRRFARARRR